ncbi:MAG: hypothetical protein B7733_05335 [Myxococcales bacterium FL481]|nr:MAG: hypothetical protein B7733_05335 [Myxococcales bacterium FL481]
MRQGTLALAVFCFASIELAGCSKIRARDLVREGNELYSDGQYEAAIQKYNEAQEHEPGGNTVLWNRACAAESLVLPLKEAENPQKLEARRKYADIALADFQAWYNGLEVKTEEDTKTAMEHRLAVLSADARCDDLVAHWQEKLKADPKAEGLYSVIARTYDDVCGKPDKAHEWYRKRTEDFPQSAQAWHTLAVREFDPLFPDPEAGIPYNADISPEERIKIADRVIGYLDNATKQDPKYRDPYVWRSMSYMQRQLARVYNDPPETAVERMQSLLAREDSMLAWKQQRAVCDIDSLPNCPVPAEVSAVVGKPQAFAGQSISVYAKVNVDSVTKGGVPTEPVVEMTLEGGLKVRQRYPSKMAGEEHPPEALAEFVEAAISRWGEGKSDTFQGKMSADGKVLEASAAPSMGCCPPPPLTPEQQAADQELKKEIQEEIESGGKRKKRRRRRRRRR